MLVHPSAHNDALTAARHRAFIAPRLLGSVVALASFPVYLLVRGAPGAIELVVFAWLVVPILLAYFLSRTGRYESAYVLSSLVLTSLMTAVAAMTGGIGSSAAVWLLAVPLEATLSASRRVVFAAASFALGGAGILVLLGACQVLPLAGPTAPTAVAALGVVAVGIYGTSFALGAAALARTSAQRRYTEEERYRLLARHVTDVVTRHGRDGAVLFVSPGAEDLFATGVSALHGHGLFDRIHVADRPAYLTALGDTAALGEPSSVEFRVRRDGVDGDSRPTAEFVWVEMRCRRLEQTAGGGGNAGGREVVAVLRNVTERKRHQQALLEARAEAERANAAKSRFLATMSHELRTPLNAVIGFSEMLMNETAYRLDADRRNEYAGLIHSSGHHLLSVVNSILDMSKIETGNFEITPEPFAPANVVAACCGILALRAREAGVELDKMVAADLPEIIADKRALNQILLNLVSNAIRFTDRGGKVTVSARAEAAHITFAVEDTGIGISEEDLARVGEPYFQGGRSYERRNGGTGLGFSIVKGLVELHGGDLSISSRIGEGTRVSVRLPFDCERARAAKKPVTQQTGAVVSYPGGHASAAGAAARAAATPRLDRPVKKSA